MEAFPVCINCSLNAPGTGRVTTSGAENSLRISSPALLRRRKPEYRFHIDFHNWNS